MGNVGNMLQNTDIRYKAEESTDEVTNGYCLNGIYIPEDILIVILSHVHPKQWLNCKLVCKSWNRIIKSRSLWHEICRRNQVACKSWPWYIYYAKFATDFFDTNFIKNGNGQEKFAHWVINPVFSGDGFAVEDEPNGSQPLPEDVEEFNGHKSCFVTSFGVCSKQQIIKFKKSPLKKHILDKYKPTIVASEWIAPRMDCSSKYKLMVRVVQSNKEFKTYSKKQQCEQWTDGIWEKVAIEIKDYPGDVDYIVYQHDGQDQLFWKGHYGIKMAGASLKILFESLQDDQIED